MNRGDIWTLADGRNVLIISLTGLEEAYGAVLALVLHDSGRCPDTAMSASSTTPSHAPPSPSASSNPAPTASQTLSSLTRSTPPPWPAWAPPVGCPGHTPQAVAAPAVDAGTVGWTTTVSARAAGMPSNF